MGSRFSSILPINVINVAVSADRAMLDNQTGIKLEFLRLAPHEAHGKTFEGKKKTKLWRFREESGFAKRFSSCRPSPCHVILGTLCPVRR